MFLTRITRPWLIGFSILATLSACTAQDYYRTQVTDIPCELNCDKANLIKQAENDYTLGFVELDDQGQFYDHGQVEALIKLLKNEKVAQYVTVFVHGWHHNASDNDFNVRRFKESLKELKKNNPGYKVTGIYVGWRGETLSLPLLRMLTFWDRKVVSEEVGRNALLDFLLRIESVVKPDTMSKNRLLTIGHSLGASVLFNALHQVLLQRLIQPENTSPRSGFGDLVVLVNPALEALRFTTLREAAKRFSHDYGFSHQQKPLLLIATSEADTTTKDTFAISRKFTTVFEKHHLLTATQYEPVTEEALSEWELDNTAIGHFEQFITHRLEGIAPAGDDYSCTTNSGWLTTVMSQHTAPRSSVPPIATMQLHPLNNIVSYNPYWIVQTDKTILPSHGFVNQKLFWCFMDLTINEIEPSPLIHTAKLKDFHLTN
ncbi:MAG: hypothetical protein WCG16_07525 [Methylococcales bacterium]